MAKKKEEKEEEEKRKKGKHTSELPKLSKFGQAYAASVWEATICHSSLTR